MTDSCTVMSMLPLLRALDVVCSALLYVAQGCVTSTHPLAGLWRAQAYAHANVWEEILIEQMAIACIFWLLHPAAIIYECVPK